MPKQKNLLIKSKVRKKIKKIQQGLKKLEKMYKKHQLSKPQKRALAEEHRRLYEYCEDLGSVSWPISKKLK